MGATSLFVPSDGILGVRLESIENGGTVLAIYTNTLSLYVGFSYHTNVNMYGTQKYVKQNTQKLKTSSTMRVYFSRHDEEEVVVAVIFMLGVKLLNK